MGGHGVGVKYGRVRSPVDPTNDPRELGTPNHR
jgi:hypothetical protein